MQLKPQDILIIIKILIRIKQNLLPWSYSDLANQLFMSPSEVHAGVKRATESRLIDRNKKPINRALEEFLIHGVKYVFPAMHGGISRGIPTSYAGPPLKNLFTFKDTLIPVWPHPEGDVNGIELKPLYKSVPDASVRDKSLYEYFVLIDAIRNGRTRERNIAIEELSKRLLTK